MHTVHTYIHTYMADGERTNRVDRAAPMVSYLWSYVGYVGYALWDYCGRMEDLGVLTDLELLS